MAGPAAPPPQRDRWHQLADAILDSNLPASDKAIFRYLLDRANYVTAELPAMYTPTQRAMGRKTSHSLRQVKYSLGHLEEHGWVACKRGHDDARRRTYVLSAGWACDCTGRRHVVANVADAVTDVADAISPSVTDRKVQRRTSNHVPIADVADVADVAHSAGMGLPDTASKPGKVQPGAEIGATPAPYIGATDRCNAAGQPPNTTERHREGEVEEEKQEPVTLKLSRARACARHDNQWTRGEGHPHCPACRALANGAGEVQGLDAVALAEAAAGSVAELLQARARRQARTERARTDHTSGITHSRDYAATGTDG